MRGGWVGVGVWVLSGCAGSGSALRPEGAGAGGSPPNQVQTVVVEVAPAPVLVPAALEPGAEASSRHVDRNLGFEIVRPEGGWRLEASDARTEEGLAVPVTLFHRERGAQVVVQVAPRLATPTQLCGRLIDGLRGEAGFWTSDPEPLPLSDDAVGFEFGMGPHLAGRVAVMEGRQDQLFLLMATWPRTAPPSVARDVEQIFESLQPI